MSTRQGEAGAAAVAGRPLPVDRIVPVGERVEVVDAGVKSDIRGLVTAGRTVLLEWIADLEVERHHVVRQQDCS
ncbi:hypothetical protein MBOT_28690 [Mycobacterium botniense]|uniref:Uncharacterized protein n=1 Tax=Mycobacterium botniense TaxID=84962 RepID=A0A7I9Y0E5_9MYCO|nr:hypothetical protein MBOT_28690 [Mycobacterium botniense]